MDNPGYTIVRTNDGSCTVYLHEYEEHMHSLSGAYEEALLKHVYPSGILRRDTSSLRVLDIGFGLGYNILALIAELQKTEYRGTLTIVSFEKDRSLLPALHAIEFEETLGNIYRFIQDAYRNGSSHDGNMSISLMFGDARQSVLAMPFDQFDAVFFDPFSPSRNPELWSVDFFSQIHRLMADDAILTTYSSAPQIRAAMIDAGFVIGKGPSVGGKREGTIASKTNVIPVFPPGFIDELHTNIRAVPYRDPDFTSDKETILHRRRKEITLLRAQQKR